MQRRVLAGGIATFLVAIGAAIADFLAEGDYVAGVLAAGLVGGFLAGALSRREGHLGAGARAGGYGGAAAFAGFVVVGGAQALLGGDSSVLLLGFETVLVGLLVVPLYALSGALAAAAGVRLRRVTGQETAL